MTRLISASTLVVLFGLSTAVPAVADTKAPAQAPVQAPYQAPLQAPAQAPYKSPIQSPAQAPAAMPKAPEGAPPAPPAPPAAARLDSGYRTFSYEPAAGYGYYGRTGMRSPSYLDARSKALGRY